MAVPRQTAAERPEKSRGGKTMASETSKPAIRREHIEDLIRNYADSKEELRSYLVKEGERLKQEEEFLKRAWEILDGTVPSSIAASVPERERGTSSSDVVYPSPIGTRVSKQTVECCDGDLQWCRFLVGMTNWRGKRLRFELYAASERPRLNKIPHRGLYLKEELLLQSPKYRLLAAEYWVIEVIDKRDGRLLVFCGFGYASLFKGLQSLRYSSLSRYDRR